MNENDASVKKPLPVYVGVHAASASSMGDGDSSLGLPDPLHAITTQGISDLSSQLTATDLHNIQHILPILIKSSPQVGTKPISPPPHPQVTQSLAAIPLGYQFAFNQLTSPTPYGNTITAYRIYRNKTANNFSGAQLIRTITHDPTHQGAVTVQDSTGGSQTYYYFVTAVDSTGQESSSPGAFQASAVTSGTANPNISNAVGSTVSPSTTSGTFVVIPEMTVTVTTKGNKVLVIFTGTFTVSVGAGIAAAIAIFRDGTQVSQVVGFTVASTTTFVPVGAAFIDSPPAGSHTWDIRWDTQPGSTLVANGTQRQVQLVELG